MKIVELRTISEMRRLFPLIRQLNPGMTEAVFKRYLPAMQKAGYRALAAIDGKEILGTTGFWVGTRFWCGPYVEVDNLVVAEKYRNCGVGKRLMEALEKEAKKRSSSILIADSYTHNAASHRFYFREGYIIKGFCFVKELKG